MKPIYARMNNNSKLDPRVIRTHRLILDAFNELIKEYGAIRTISIQQIAERAGVNRVTFYAHFKDKYELLEYSKRDRFRRKLAKYQHDNEDITMSELIAMVVDFIDDYQKWRRLANKQYEPLLETAIQTEILAVIRQMHSVDDENAVFLSWAIFGSISDWSQDRERVPKEIIHRNLLKSTEKVLS